MITALKRIVRTGSVGFIRNTHVSFSAIYVMTITLLVIGGSLIFSALLGHTLTSLKEKVDVNVYFTTDAPEEQVFAFKSKLESLPNVKDVSYTSREDALAQFRDRHATDELTLRALDELGENPLGSSVAVRAYDPSQYEGIVDLINTTIEQSEDIIVDRINFNQNRSAIDRLSSIIRVVDNITRALLAVLIVVTVLITFNTIRLAIYTSREEISVMRLVGASNAFIRGPFVIQGAFYGVVSGILALIVLYPLTYYLGPGTNAFFGLNIFSYYLSDFGRIFSIVVGSGIGLGVLSSGVAISRYLRV